MRRRSAAKRKRVRDEGAALKRAISYATCVWAALFTAPHLWWALGSPLGFPGGAANHALMMGSAWRYIYDVVVIVCGITGIAVALTLLRPPERVTRRWIPYGLAWFACGILTVRGVAGLVADGWSDLVWSPSFVLGGMLFGGVAWFANAGSRVQRKA